MDDGLSAAIQSVLSDPKQVAMIQGLAGQLMGDRGSEAPWSEETAMPEASNGGESPIAGLIQSLRSASGSPSRSEALLTAMTPYLREERQEKLQRAMKLSRVLRTAEGFFRSGGGDLLGL